MKGKFRLLITGSRYWDDPKTILNAIRNAVSDHCKGRQLVIVQGDCPTGADKFARDFATLLGWELETYPADWDKYGKKAGPIRNQQMVDSHPELALAFLLRDSKGTKDCIRRCEQSGVEVIIYREEES